jgi:hypothetical protein
VWSETRRCFIANGCQTCFRICLQEGPRKSGLTGTEWNTSVLVYDDDDDDDDDNVAADDDDTIWGVNINTTKMNKEALLEAKCDKVQVLGYNNNK